MSQTKNNNPCFRYALFTAAIGFLAGLSLATWYRVYATMFPINIFGLLVLMHSLTGFPAGAALAGGKKGGVRLMTAVVAGIAVFAACAVVNQNFTTGYLLGKAYYPYPLPEHAAMRVAALAAAILLSPLPFLAGGWLIADRLKRAANRRTVCATLACGTAAGGVSGFVLTLYAGPYLWLLAGAALLAMPLPAGRWWRVACAAVIAAAMVYSATKKEEALYVWRAGDYKKLDTRWTTYYRVDFISFNDGRCVGGVNNTLLMWYACPQVEMLPAEVRMIMKAVGKGKERVLSMGRTDGMYAQALAHYYPDVKELTAVEYDPVVAEKMNGEYARYANYIFRKPGFSARAADFRTFLKNETEKYDLIFFNGIGIALFYFPGSLIRQEDYLTGGEAYDLVFKRLTDDGVFVIDWGSSREVEAVPMMANVPPGVHARAYWFTIGQYPMVGIPLFFVFASRSEAELDRISRELETMPSFRRVIPSPGALSRGKFGDNKPFHNHDIARFVLFVSTWLALGMLIVMRIFLTKVRAGFPAVACFSTSGLTIGMIAGMVMTRNPRFFTAGAGVGVAGSAAALAIGAAAGLALGEAFGKNRGGVAAVPAGLVLGAVCVWNIIMGSQGAAVGGALLVGCLGSLLWGSAWRLPPPDKIPAALAASWLGGILGVYLCQFLIFFVGFNEASWTMALCAALTGLHCAFHQHNSFSTQANL